MTADANGSSRILRIEGLRAGVGSHTILDGIDLEVGAGEVHAIMGPNGSGKSTLSHVLMGRPGYVVYSGHASLDGVDLLGLPTWERARAGLFLAHQYPIEVPGVSLADTLGEALVARGQNPRDLAGLVPEEAARIGLDPRLLTRSLNVDLSGGERKRNETLQLVLLRPRVAILDEIDSGLDIDALRVVARRVAAATDELHIGVLAITHYARLLSELRPDVVHVLHQGRVVRTGGPELAEELERTGYAAYGGEGAQGGERAQDHSPAPSGSAAATGPFPATGPTPAAGQPGG